MIENEPILDLKYGHPVEEILPKVLLDPARDLLERPSKRIRAELVTIGFEWEETQTQEHEEKLKEVCALVLESLHAGSLAIDDIEDGSQMRRGEPTLHRLYGVPIALNVGSWLYFYPLEKIKELQLPAGVELGLYQAYHQALLRAHYGQAIDLGVRVDSLAQQKVKGLCLTSMELKTGALTEFALSMGAIVKGASSESMKLLSWLGRGFGIALQMFDDLGNAVGEKDPGKKWEDFRLRRPGWFWACAADSLGASEYFSFCESIRALPEEGRLSEWMQAHPFVFDYCRREAEGFLDSLFERARLEGGSLSPSLQKLEILGLQLKGAYA